MVGRDMSGYIYRRIVVTETPAGDLLVNAHVKFDGDKGGNGAAQAVLRFMTQI